MQNQQHQNLAQRSRVPASVAGSAHAASSQASSPDHIAASLAALLEQAQQHWLAVSELAHRQQEALRAADHASLDKLILEQQQMTPKLRQIEQSRRELVVQAIRTLPDLRSQTVAQPRLSQIAVALGPQHASLVQRAAALKALATHASAQLSALRLATSNLAVHVEAVIRQVSQALSADGTYTRRGDVRANAPAIALDLAH
jgi:hypothetical protein